MTSYGDYGQYPPPMQPADMPAVDGRLAGWWRRVGASLIDGIITAAIAGGIGLAVWHSSTRYLAVVIGLVYTVLMLAGRGRTVGNLAVGTAVVSLRDDVTGPGLGATTAFVRWLIQELLAITGIGFFLDVLWPLWDDRNQTLHDKVASTLVVLV